MEYMTEKTIRIRKLLKTDQACKYIVEAQADGDSKEWKKLGAYVDKKYAEGYVAGFIFGLQYLTTTDKQIATPIFQDEWQGET